MDENGYRFLDDDDNAQDEFSAGSFFKRKDKNTKLLNGIPLVKNRIFQDVTNKNLNKYVKANLQSNDVENSVKISTKNIQIKNDKINKFLNIIPNIPKKPIENVIQTNGKVSGVKSKTDKNNKDFHTEIFNNEIPMENYFLPKNCDKDEHISEITHPEAMDMDFHNDDKPEDINEKVSQGLRTPAHGYNKAYKRCIVVAEPSTKAQIVKVHEGSITWKTVMDSCKIEKRIQLSSARKSCTPQQQFFIRDNKQYESQCLIDAFYSENLFDKENDTKIVDEASKKVPRSMENVSLSHFHEMFLERLPCNCQFDFMPNSKEVTGRILGGFVNDLFELANTYVIANEVIHIAVDLIYEYLSRVNDVPLNDLKWVTLGSIWVAGKFFGSNITQMILQFASCSYFHLRKAELRLLMVIDFNLTKPYATNFRNRFLNVERPNSTVLHLSSFILDMTLHCYTIMLMSSSKRAAAAIWLARLIDTFKSVKHNDIIWTDMVAAKTTMDSVWPESFVKISGYKHHDISSLALKMHVIILAFIADGEPMYPSVTACHEKYSSPAYGELTMSYEKFTAQSVFYASELYCRLNNLELKCWMEKNEFETLWRNFADNKVVLRRSTSQYGNNVHYDYKSSYSCPAEVITSKSLVNQQQVIEHSKEKNKELEKMDSGCWSMDQIYP